MCFMYFSKQSVCCNAVCRNCTDMVVQIMQKICIICNRHTLCYQLRRKDGEKTEKGRRKDVEKVGLSQ